MSRVTSKLQVTIPKAIAEQYGIQPGDDIEFEAAGQSIRVIPPRAGILTRLSLEERLRLFDAAIERQRLREKAMRLSDEEPAERDWRREDLYSRGEPR